MDNAEKGSGLLKVNWLRHCVLENMYGRQLPTRLDYLSPIRFSNKGKICECMNTLLVFNLFCDIGSPSYFISQRHATNWEFEFRISKGTVSTYDDS